MPLCGSSFCGCAVTSTPADFAEIDGTFPTIDVAGNGTGASPWSLTLNDEWAQEVADAVTSGFGATDVQTWVTAANTLSQGANISRSGERAWYVEIGDGFVHAHFAATIISAGTAANAIALRLPITPADPSDVIGEFWGVDTGTTVHTGVAVGISTNVVQFYVPGNGTALGITPAWTLTNTDVFRCSVRYRKV